MKSSAARAQNFNEHTLLGMLQAFDSEATLHACRPAIVRKGSTRIRVRVATFDLPTSAPIVPITRDILEDQESHNGAVIDYSVRAASVDDALARMIERHGESSAASVSSALYSTGGDAGHAAATHGWFCHAGAKKNKSNHKGNRFGRVFCAFERKAITRFRRVKHGLFIPHQLFLRSYSFRFQEVVLVFADFFKVDFDQFIYVCALSPVPMAA